MTRNWVLPWLLGLAVCQIAIALCPAGRTGSTCESPICTNHTTPAYHDGLANYGDTIAEVKSSECVPLAFYVDSFIQDMFILASYSTPEVYPHMILLDSSNEEVPTCDEYFTDQQRLNKYCNIPTLVKGIYTVKLSGEIMSSCQIRVTAKTQLVVDGGFVSDLRDDNVQSDPTLFQDNQGITRYPLYGIPSTFVFNVHSEVFPTQPLHVYIYQDETFQGSLSKYDLATRYGCGFPHMTSKNITFTDIAYPYFASIQGLDGDGNKWQRIYKFQCDTSNMPTPESPLTTQTAPICFNNGTVKKGGCICSKYFEGTYCEWPVCFNGGTLNQADGKCYCDAGFSGEHCENVKCKVASDDKFDDDHRVLTFVIRSSLSMSSQMEQIVAAAKNISAVYDMEYPGYFISYILSVVQSKTLLYTKQFSDFDSFIDGIQNITHSSVENTCEDALFSGIGSVLSNPLLAQYQNSPIFVFSDGVASDDIQTQQYVLQQASDTRAQIFFVLSNSANGNCNIDITSSSYLSLYALSAFTQGLTIKSELSELANTISELAYSLYDSSTITMNDLYDCRNAPPVDYFFVDDSISVLYISATGINISLNLIYPDSKSNSPAPFLKSGNFYLWKFDQPANGSYTLKFKSDISILTECSYRIYTASSKYGVYFGATDELTNDRYSKEPIAGQDSHVVVRLSNYWMADPSEVKTNVNLWYNDIAGNKDILYTSQGIYRDQCVYNLYYGSFMCQQPLQHFYMKLLVYNPSGVTIQRTVTGYCTTVLPPPAGETCLNGGVTSNGTCICPTHFTGSKCQFINCENQGTPMIGSCACPPGFNGQFCENYACTSYNEFVHPSNDGRSLSILLHDSLTTRTLFRNINNAALHVIQDIEEQYPNWIDYYQLYKFNDTKYQQLYDGQDPGGFLQQLNSAYQNNLQTSDVSCNNLELFSTIDSILHNAHVSWGGIVYVFVYGVAKNESSYFNEILTHVKENKIQINVIQMSLMPCGNDITTDGLMLLTQATGGSYYTASQTNAGNVFSSITTNYGSGLIYERQSSQCSDTTFYVPIDAETQSFTVYVQGQLTSDVTYSNPNGVIIDNANFANIWSDGVTSSRMDQIVSRCDSGWEYHNGHCWKIGFVPSNWEEAHNDCAKNHATLSNIYNKNDDSFVDGLGDTTIFWIGLNNRVDINNFVWDSLNNATISLSYSKYSAWKPGQPIYDVNKRCVLDDNVNTHGWMVADCSDKHFYMCSKGPYSDQFDGTEDDDRVLSGIWGITVSAVDGCSVSVRAQSSIQVLTSFTTDVHNDFGSGEPTSYTQNNHLIGLVTGISDESAKTFEYAHVYDDNGNLIQSETINQRSNCRFNYISTSFQCLAPIFQMYLTGTDDMGNLYQRIVPVICQDGVEPDSCENNGVYSEGSCLCAPGYTGEHCEMAMCEHGHLSATISNCNCDEGWSGRLCSIPYCVRNSHSAIPSNNNKSFVLLLDGVSSGPMLDVQSNISSILTDLLRKTTFSHPLWFTNFVAIIFRDANSVKSGVPTTSRVIKSSTYADFVTQITNELSIYKYSSDSNGRSIFKALDYVFADPAVALESLAFVITSSGADDTNFDSLTEKLIATTHSSIYEIFIGDNSAPGGGSYSDIGVATLFEAAHETGGAVYQMPASKLGAYWANILNTLYDSFYITSHHVSNCSLYTEYIQLGSDTTDLIIDVFAEGTPSVRVVNSQGDSDNLITTMATKTNVLSHFSQSAEKPGVWSVSLDAEGKNTGVCMFNIRAQSQLYIHTAFTQDVESDGGLHDGSSYSYPLADGLQNAILAAASSGATLNFAQIFDIEDRTLVWSSPLISRKGCAYSYISAKTYVCDRQTFLLAIDGQDSVGHPIRRVFTYHCQGDIVTPVSTSTSSPVASTEVASTVPSLPFCDVSAPFVDLIIAFDSSFTVDENSFQQIIDLFSQLQNVFTIATDKTRVLLGTYDQSSDFQKSDINTISNDGDFVKRLLEIKESGYTGLDGNNIDEVLKYIFFTTATVPLRDNVRKIVTFISSQGWDKGNFFNSTEHGYANPETDIERLKQQNVEFIPIGLGNKANLDQLKIFSAKCLQKVVNADGIGDVVNFIAKTLCSNQKQC